MSLFKSEIIVTPKIIGAIDGAAAAAGQVGEVVSSLVAVGSVQSLTTTTAKNITSIALTPGNWIVSGAVNFSATSASVAAAAVWAGGIGTTTGTLPTDGSEVNIFPGVLTTTTFKTAVTLSPKVISVTSTTTVYLVGVAA